MAQNSPPFFMDIHTEAELVNGVHTDIAVLGFSNYVVVLVTQLASIGSLIQAVTSGSFYNSANSTNDLAGAADYESTAPTDVKFLLGNSNTPATTMYQICATQLAQKKREKSPMDTRPLLLGISIKNLNVKNKSLVINDNDDASADTGSATFPLNEILQLVDKCRVW